MRARNTSAGLDTYRETEHGAGLLLWGEGDPNGGAAVARSFAPRLPDAELVTVPGAEHAPRIDDLVTCATRAHAFLSGQRAST
jgi:pimeloyl-ACP methyl ester carboxylesterase